MKNNMGITLVALVVTIIVLIILAGISINLILGDNGIITIAKKAKENTEISKLEEEKGLNELYTQLNAENSSSENLPYDSITKLAEFKRAIAEAISNRGVETSENDTKETMVNNIGKISGEGNSKRTDTGTFTTTLGQWYDVTLGYKPTFVQLIAIDGTAVIQYSEQYSKQKYIIGISGNTGIRIVDLENGPDYGYFNFKITDTGFSYWRAYDSALSCIWIAGK